MILLIDTSTSICRFTFIEGDDRQNIEWQADRTLANKLLGYLDQLLKSQGKTWSDISALGVYRGPGSFTGLRIGLTVMNTIAETQNIIIVGASGDDWQDKALIKISHGKNEKIVLPFYGSGANITIPRK